MCFNHTYPLITLSYPLPLILNPSSSLFFEMSLSLNLGFTNLLD